MILINWIANSSHRSTLSLLIGNPAFLRNSFRETGGFASPPFDGYALLQFVKLAEELNSSVRTRTTVLGWRQFRRLEVVPRRQRWCIGALGW
jgi:hypothetical protein